MDTRTKKILRMYNRGDYYSDIVSEFGISRQRVWQILKKNYSHVRNRRTPHVSNVISNQNEDFFEEEFKRRKLKYTKMPYNHPFDFIVNNKRVEVKWRKKSIRDGKYHFTNVVSTVKVDYYILSCIDADAVFFVIPSKKISNHVNLTYPYKMRSKYAQYLEKWSLI